MDVRTLMRRAALHYSHREAIVHNDTRLTFAQAWERADTCKKDKGGDAANAALLLFALKRKFGV